MNDNRYDTKINFKGSFLYNEIMYKCTPENLKCLKNACEFAIKTHIKENNTSQIKYFSEALELINNKLKKVSTIDGYGKIK